MMQAQKTIQSSRDRLLASRAINLKTRKAKILLFFVAIAFLIAAGDPSYDLPSSVALMENLHDDSDSNKVGTEQTCAVGIWNKDTHQLDENPKCTASSELLHMERPETKKRLTYMLLYYNNHKHLAQQVHSWKNFSQAALDQIQFVIVDDGSTLGHTAADLFAANRNYIKGLDILVYKIDQDLAWNIGGARNLGFYMSNTEWIFMNDADIEVKTDTMDFVTRLLDYKPQQQENGTTTGLEPVYLYFKRWREAGFKNHPAVMLIKRKHYWMLGGCDEDFVGHYGQTDPHFRLKVKLDKTLHGYTTEDLMNAQQISPLYEMAESLPCPAGMTCLEPYVGQTPSRDTKPNKDLIKKKRKIGKWSNTVLRFTWKRGTWESSSWWQALLGWFQ
mmetsp:Transcript_38847/g.93913  ORF Transcript_38847/g.93913 Transcript_38847/m.93913 type:complete len:388 (+) Transcript_38847:94-1257(+)